MSKQSVIHSHIPAQAVHALVGFDAKEYESLGRIGINISPRIVRKMMKEIYGMDSIQQGLTAPTIVTPIQFLQNWMPGFVAIMTAARKADDIMGLTTVGNWEDEEVVQPVLETTGTAVPYGDLTNTPLSNYNVQFEQRTIVRFEEGLKIGILEEARAAKINISSADAKRKGAGQALEIQRNQVAFYGYNDGANRTYGFLNDPNLPAYVTVAAGASMSAQWPSKTYLEIIADIRSAVSALRTQSQDTIDPEKVDLTMAISTNRVDYLSVTSNLGASTSVRQWLNATYPRIRVVSAPQLNGANGGANVFYLFADRVDDASTDDGRSIVQVVPSKFQVLGVQQLIKGYEEAYSNATAGVMVKRPYAFVRRSGI